MLQNLAAISKQADVVLKPLSLLTDAVLGVIIFFKVGESKPGVKPSQLQVEFGSEGHL